MFAMNTLNSNDITFKSRNLDNDLVEIIKDFKTGTAYRVNEKLREVNKLPLTSEEKAIVVGFPLLPKKVLLRDTYVYRGVGESCDFSPLKSIIPGEMFIEKGFTSVSPFRHVAKTFRYSMGVLEKILLPMGTEVIDIDSLLKANTSKLPTEVAQTVKVQPKHEWVLLPGASYKVLDYSDKKTYFYVSDGLKKYKMSDGGIGMFNLLLINSK